MRGIFIESLRGALVRLLRTFIMIVIILLIVFIIGLFHQEKVHALVFKYNEDITFQTNSFSGNLVNNDLNYIGSTFTTNLVTANYDYDLIGIKLNRFSLIGREHITLNNPGNSYVESCSNPSGNGEFCYSYTLTPSSTIQSGTLTNGSFTINANLYGNKKVTPCYFDSSVSDNFVICPLDKDNDYYTQFLFVVTYNGYDNAQYLIDFSNLKFFYNYDSTEVVNGLKGITIEQQNTTQAIEDLTTQQEQAQQFIENNNVSSSQTQFQGGVSDLSQQINAQISGVNDLTQIVLLPVTLFMDLSTGTCTPLHLVVPFTNNEIDLPCMKPIYEQHFNGLLTVFSTVVCAVTTYWVSVNSAKLIKEILDCDNDRIEVIDL